MTEGAEKQTQTRPRVRILMGVRNGATHLGPQLDSIASQKGVEWTLHCSDDGSVDESRLVIRRFSNEHPGSVTLVDGPGRGFSANYMSMIRHLPKTPGLTAFADQDDIWLPDKLCRAASILEPFGKTPTLYCGRRADWYLHRGDFYPSRRIRRPCTLQNGLVENVACGNTIVLNPAAARLARRAAWNTGPVFAHDWWLYLVIAACGGAVAFDNGPPRILYRQHGANALGAGRGLRSQWHSKIGVLNGHFSDRIASNLDALAAIEAWMTPESRRTYHAFRKARKRRGIGRLAALRAVRPFRQSIVGDIGFWGAAALGRI